MLSDRTNNRPDTEKQSDSWKRAQKIINILAKQWCDLDPASDEAVIRQLQDRVRSKLLKLRNTGFENKTAESTGKLGAALPSQISYPLLSNRINKYGVKLGDGGIRSRNDFVAMQTAVYGNYYPYNSMILVEGAVLFETANRCIKNYRPDKSSFLTFFLSSLADDQFSFLRKERERIGMITLEDNIYSAFGYDNKQTSDQHIDGCADKPDDLLGEERNLGGHEEDWIRRLKMLVSIKTLLYFGLKYSQTREVIGANMESCREHAAAINRVKARALGKRGSKSFEYYKAYYTYDLFGAARTYEFVRFLESSELELAESVISTALRGSDAEFFLSLSTCLCDWALLLRCDCLHDFIHGEIRPEIVPGDFDNSKQTGNRSRVMKHLFDYSDQTHSDHYKKRYARIAKGLLQACFQKGEDCIADDDAIKVVNVLKGQQ